MNNFANNNADALNQQISNLIAFYESGGNPNAVMQQMLQKNPQLNQAGTQLANMTQGRTMSETLLQLAWQNGVNEQNLQGLARMLGVK